MKILRPLVALFLTLPVFGQAPTTSPQTPPPPAPTVLTLRDALQRAKANSTQYLAALTDSKVAHEDTIQARAALLPSLTYNNAYLYTQGIGSAATTVPGAPPVRYIANNSVHEYVSQANPHEELNLALGGVSDFRRAQAAEAAQRARAEIATRGLVVTVVQTYYGLVVAQRKYANAENGATEAENFLSLSQKLEKGGEVAHSDVIKAQLQNNDKQNALRQAALGMQKARLDLAVLVFPNFNQDFSVIDDMANAAAVPSLAEAEQMAKRNSPDLRAALETAKAAGEEVAVARSAHFPTLSLDYFYGIDSTHFAVRDPAGFRNLGYSAVATLNIPVWTWGATQSKVKQAEYRQQQAKAELSAAQRELIANLISFHAEAESAHVQLDTLKTSMDLAAESLRLTNLRYRGGEATALEVVDAQNTLVAARDAFADGELRYRQSIATLQTLTGAF